jgi:hypothetical protein
MKQHSSSTENRTFLFLSTRIQASPFCLLSDLLYVGGPRSKISLQQRKIDSRESTLASIPWLADAFIGFAACTLLAAGQTGWF